METSTFVFIWLAATFLVGLGEKLWSEANYHTKTESSAHSPLVTAIFWLVIVGLGLLIQYLFFDVKNMESIIINAIAGTVLFLAGLGSGYLIYHKVLLK